MNRFRIGLNVVLMLGLGAAALHLLSRERWVWIIDDDMLVFTGGSLRLLAISAMFLALFVGAVTQGWIRGSVPLPPADEPHPHPAYRGRLLVRYWYFVLPGLACFLGALWLA